MRKERVKEERDMTTHSIKFEVIPTLVVLLNLASVIFICTGTYSYSRFQNYWGFTIDPSVNSSSSKSPQLPAKKQRGKLLAMLLKSD